MYTRFDIHAEEVKRSTSLSQSNANIRAGFRTIIGLINFLYDDNIDLETDITSDFIRDVMRVDFNKVINSLRNYRGTDRRGIKEAKKNMNDSLKSLYGAIDATEKGNTNKKVDTLIKCRESLESAYYNLEHLQET